MDGVMMGIDRACNTMLAVGMTGGDGVSTGRTLEIPGLGWYPLLIFVYPLHIPPK